MKRMPTYKDPLFSYFHFIYHSFERHPDLNVYRNQRREELMEVLTTQAIGQLLSEEATIPG